MITEINTRDFIGQVIRITKEINRRKHNEYYEVHGVCQFTPNLLLVSECDETEYMWWLTLTDPGIINVDILEIPDN